MVQCKNGFQFLIKVSLLGLALSALSFLTGCAMPSQSNSMTIAKMDLPQGMRKKVCQYSDNICLGTIEGGSKTYPFWASKVDNKEFKTALEQSLTNVDLYNSKNARYVLNAKLEKLKQPLLGANMTVTCVSHYQIFDQKSKKMIFDKTVSTPYTAKFTSALLGTERLKLANEGAVKENIKDLMNNLYDSCS